MTNNFTPFEGNVCPVHPREIVQLQLDNGNEPVNYAEIFHWGSHGRGTFYPKILGYKVVTQQAFEAYQTKLKEARNARKHSMATASGQAESTN